MLGGSEPGGTDVERLVDRVADGEVGEPRWSALLVVLNAAARGSAVDPEREQAAVAAFQAAATGRPARPGRCGRARRRRPLRSARALAGGLAAVFALCGVAVAAGADVLPARGHAAHSGPPPAPVARTALPAPTAAAPSAGARPSASPSPAPRPPASRPPDTAVPPPPHSRAAAPPRAVRALCRAYAAAVRNGRTPGAKLTARLQREAGGSHRVAAYCRALLAAAPGAAAK
ncbi:hypothetical protein OG900_35490 [Streptomyces sp. NBC_00433]